MDPPTNPLILDGDQIKVCLHHCCKPCGQDEPIYVAHQDCWDLAISMGKRVKLLFHFAMMTRQLPPPMGPPVHASFPIELDAATPLGGLFRGLASRLPLEAQYEIMGYLQGHLVSTNLGHSKFFGDYCAVIQFPLHHWTCLIDCGSVITGLYLDTRSIAGVASKPTSNSTAAPTATIPRLRNPPFMSTIGGTGAFLTTASIQSINRLQVRRDKSRCTGLLIEHLDGGMETLGCWDAVDACSVQTIFDATCDGPLKAIAFHGSTSSPHRVTNVTAVVRDSPDPPESKVFRNTFLVWWFNGFADKVEEWNGISDPVHEVSPLPNFGNSRARYMPVPYGS
ncbi:uncharacterized protein DNG_04457 [Cephalotrichum gorgonifer]|uniref:Uncharacterized protein n=1 Tax=Cephalotrichum gorgonifer TaxID=2041049 RepID=A0AAE8SUY3_9PEZI|nr:uncharacterized protein DNG_04457 [Cephalotrichum gorgonifer]